MWETVLTPTLRPNDKLTLILLSSFYINMLFYPLFEKIFLINIIISLPKNLNESSFIFIQFIVVLNIKSGSFWYFY